MAAETYEADEERGLVPYAPTATALARREYTDEQRRLIKTACMASQATDDEFALFLEVARQTGLNPLARQIYAIHRKSGRDAQGHDRYQMTIQTGIDGYRLIAARTSRLAGIDDPTFDTEEGDHPHKATVTVWRMIGGQRCPFTASARWNEYAQVKDEWENNKKTGRTILTGQWGKMPWLMLGKCAEALALRKAFPAELSGIYTGDEMEQADNPPPPAPSTAAPTVESESAEAAEAHQRQAAHRIPVQPEEMSAMSIRIKALGMEAPQVHAFVATHCGQGKRYTKALTREDWDKLTAAVERQEAKQSRAKTALAKAQPPATAADEALADEADALTSDARTDYDLSHLDGGTRPN